MTQIVQVPMKRDQIGWYVCPVCAYTLSRTHEFYHNYEAVLGAISAVSPVP